MVQHRKDAVSPGLADSEDFHEFRTLLKKLMRHTHLSAQDLLLKALEVDEIPASVFASDLSPLETVVKYLRENLNLSTNSVAERINRSEKTVWQAYHSSQKKKSDKFEIKGISLSIPVSRFSIRKLSILESVVSFLISEHNMKYSQVADLIKRDDRTIWTVHHRAEQKLKNGR
jgi:hypothetical protein